MSDEEVQDIVGRVRDAKHNPLGIDSPWRTAYVRDVNVLLKKLGVNS